MFEKIKKEIEEAKTTKTLHILGRRVNKEYNEVINSGVLNSKLKKTVTKEYKKIIKKINSAKKKL